MRTVSLLWFSTHTRANKDIRRGKKKNKLCQPSSCLISFCKMKQIKLLIHHKKAVRIFNSQPIAYALLFRMNMICFYFLMYFSTKSFRLNNAEKKDHNVRDFLKNLIITVGKLYLSLSAFRFACISYIPFFLWFKFWHHKMTQISLYHFAGWMKSLRIWFAFQSWTWCPGPLAIISID